MTSQVLIGTSGYDYPEWKGVFYPEGLRRADFLAYYATWFDALELNSTFYCMPTAERMADFLARSEGRLAFSVKASRLLTHEVGPLWRRDAVAFREAMAPLLEKDALAAVLFQFPQSFHYTRECRLYLDSLIREFGGFPVVVEFRHREWIRESVLEGLADRGAGIAFCDMPRLKSLPEGFSCGLATRFVGPEAYLRLHGRNAQAWYAHSPQDNGSARYRYDYSERELEDFVPVIGAAVQEGRRVQIYFNNHPDGGGAKNACQMKGILERLKEKALGSGR